ALWSLAAAGDPAAAFVGTKLRPPTPVDPAQVVRWIDALDDPQFPTRERAMAALIQVADQAEEALRGALDRTRSTEVRQRIHRILDAAREVDPMPDRLREMRAVEVLETVATPAARERLA